MSEGNTTTTQLQRIAGMRHRVMLEGGTTTLLAPLPADVEEELLRQVLGLPETLSPFYSTTESERLNQLRLAVEGSIA